MDFVRGYLREVEMVAARLDGAQAAAVAGLVAETRAAGGRVFFLGVGGSAATCSHAVNDFRKIGGVEAYAPTDNVSELTARTNDDGWPSSFSEWLAGSRLSSRDLVFVLSVGGGDLARNVSPNLVAALEYAKSRGARVAGIVGRDGGHTARVADACVLVPTVNDAHVTPHTESFHGVVLHMIVSHPLVKTGRTKWESVR